MTGLILKNLSEKSISSILKFFNPVRIEKVVPQVGLEPTCREATDFESVMYTNSITEAYHLLVAPFYCFLGACQRLTESKFKQKYLP